MQDEPMVRDPDVQGKCDVYAFACVTFELLTGQVPWPQDKPFGRNEVVQAVVEDGWRPELVRPRPLPPVRVVRVPRSLMAVFCRWVAKVMTVHPAQPPTLFFLQDQIFDGLTNALKGEPLAPMRRLPKRT